MLQPKMFKPAEALSEDAVVPVDDPAPQDAQAPGPLAENANVTENDEKTDEDPADVVADAAPPIGPNSFSPLRRNQRRRVTAKRRATKVPRERSLSTVAIRRQRNRSPKQLRNLVESHLILSLSTPVPPRHQNQRLTKKASQPSSKAFQRKLLPVGPDPTQMARRKY